jgi:hypothetical protein
MPDVAPLVAESEEVLNHYRNRAINLLSLAGLSGLPQVSIPLAARLGAPLGLSLVGPAGIGPEPRAPRDPPGGVTAAGSEGRGRPVRIAPTSGLRAVGAALYGPP